MFDTCLAWILLLLLDCDMKYLIDWVAKDIKTASKDSKN